MNKEKIREDLNSLSLRNEMTTKYALNLFKREAQRQIELTDQLIKFWLWFSDGDAIPHLCPYTRSELGILAHELLEYYTCADDEFLQKYRKDYDVLELVCEGKYISSRLLIDMVKLIDYIVDQRIV